MAEFKLSRIRYNWKGQWAAGTDYIVDDIISYGGKSYVSTTQHTSSTDFYDDLNFYNSDTPPVASPKWELMMDGYRFRGNWTTNRFYAVGDIAKYYGITYLCTTKHTSAATIAGFEEDKVNWTVYVDSMQWKGQWVSGTYYKLNDIVKQGGRLYKCTSEHTSGQVLSGRIDGDLGNWEVLTLADKWTANWQPFTPYQLNDVVKYGGTVYRCIVGHSSIGKLEPNVDKWSVVHSGIEYKGDWRRFGVDSTTDYYSVNDVVKYGGNLWICNTAHFAASVATGSEGPADFEEAYWDVYAPGQEYESVWSENTIYQPGDLVRYGGYLYASSTNNKGETPSPVSSDWTLLKPGSTIQGAWNSFVNYETGDAVRFGGQVYTAVADSLNQTPALGTGVNSTYWELTIPGDAWTGDWVDGANYALGDIVHYISKSYICKNVHTASVSNRPDTDTLHTYWNDYIVGDSSNVLTNYGDLKTYFTGSSTPVSVGSAGKLLKTINGLPAWGDLNLSEKVYYVSPNGVDEIDRGVTLNAPWKTIRYACEHVTGPATIFVKTGLYQEVLPIIVPAGVSIVGDEIRGSIVEPAPTLIPAQDTVYSLQILNFIRNMVQDLLLTNNVTPTQEVVAQNTSNPPATLTEVSLVRSLIDDIISVVGGGSVTVTGTNTITLDSGRLAAGVQLEENLDFIIAQSIGYMSQNHPGYSFVTAACERDVEAFVTAIITDIRYPGNYKSVSAANYYANAADGDLNASTDMFYLRDSTGLRNMTFRGLVGEITPAGVGFEEDRRVTGASFVSLDPGWGPADSRTWITTRSPYIQNCTTFGVGCVGLKLDGDLHADGLKSMVANDFTQILDDGIGIWVNKDAKTEIVSVFTYYNFIGYLSENGGKIRATNGNNSYGIYGAMAKGVNPTEDPITATVNNRYYQATVGSVLTDTTGGLMKLFYTNAGQNYTTANYTVTGGGYGAVLSGDEIRSGGVSEVRIVDPGDSSIPGGGSYLYTTNSAQYGTNTTITLAGSDENLEQNYIGMRVFITKGKGVGQYGYITAYNSVSKVASISKESTGTAGWDHIIPGTAIETTLDTTTTYAVEPRVQFTSPGASTGSATLPNLRHWRSIAYGSNKFVAISHELDNGVGNTAAYTADGTTWIASTLPSLAKWKDIVYGNGVWVAVAEGTAAASSTDGITWTSRTIPSGEWASVAYGNGTFVAVASGGTKAAYSTNGTTWTSATLPEGADWSSVTYGKGKFVAVAYSDSSTTATAYSTDGITWSVGSFAGGCSCIAYGAGKFVAFDGATVGDTVFYSTDGITWTSVTITNPRNWTSVAYGGGRFVAVANNSATALTSIDGIDWSEVSLGVVGSTWTAIAYGPVTGSTAKFVTVSGSTVGATAVSLLAYGVSAQARVKVVSGRISEVDIWEPGSGYISAPTFSLTDPNNTSDVTVSVKINNGVLGSPSISNAGLGYQSQSTSVTLTGDGFMESYQIGKELVVSNLTRVPRPGANLSIFGINDYTYKVTSATVLNGSAGNYTAKLIIIKSLDRAESPDHATGVEIREQYSQIRITGHDLLNIGLGNIYQTNFPDVLHPRGTIASPENEIVEREGGRVFYTSTNDLGNFRVGELFAVEQATGTVTLNAEFFELQGLEELRLGGVSVGTTAVVIREFSTDSTFTADSNNIVPTQRAIKAYVTRRVSGGGSDAIAGSVTAGLIKVGPNSISTTTGPIRIPVKVNFKKSIDGTMLAMAYFTRRN